MKTRFIALALSLSAGTLTQGCAAETDEGPAAALDLQAGGYATVSDHTFASATASCVTRIFYPRVYGISDEASKRINQVIAKHLEPYQCGAERVSSNGELSVTLNEGGLLSIRSEIRKQTQKGAEAHLQAMVFELRTGTQLALSDIVTDAGKKRIENHCRNSQQDYTCDEATFQLEQEGLRFLPVDGPMSPSEDPSLFHTWKDLGSFVRSALVKKLGSAR